MDLSTPAGGPVTVADPVAERVDVGRGVGPPRPRNGGSTPTRPLVEHDPRPLRFDAAVPRALVHRAAIAEVFVTDSAPVGADTYRVAAQLPRGHYMGEGPRRYDFQILVEIVRQAGVLVAHTHLDVGVEVPFIFRRLALHVADPDQLLIGPAPDNVVVHTSVEPERTGAGRLRGLTFRGRVEISGAPALHGEGRLLFVTRRSYDALRRRGREEKVSRQQPAGLSFAPAAPQAVGRRNPRNVVITEPTPLVGRRLAASLVVDRTHPYLFDHPLDHVPGNLSLEACRQAAVAAVSREYGVAADGLAVAGAEVDFAGFAETDLITRVVAEVGDLGRHEPTGAPCVPVTVELRQADTTTTAATVRVAAWS